MNRRIDLHMHSTASDGTWDAKGIVEAVSGAGVDLFALTDHNSVENIASVRRLAAEKGIDFIPGVEIGVRHNGCEKHILIYNIDASSPKLLSILEERRIKFIEYNRRLVDFVQKKRVEVSVEEYDAYKNDPSRGGWNTLNYFIDKKLCTGLSDFAPLVEGFRETISYETPQELLEKIKEMAGAVPILAHPPAYQSGDLMDSHELLFFKEIGIKGIECYSPYFQKRENSVWYLNFCRNHGLYITAGSDCHGTFFANRRTGYPEAYEDDLLLF